LGVIVRHSYRNELRILVLLAMLLPLCLAHAAWATQTTSPNAPAHVSRGSNVVEETGLIPDSRSLLPVAAIIGFSFLFGGIVCSIKPRP